MSPIQNARVYLASVPAGESIVLPIGESPIHEYQGRYPQPGIDIVHDSSSTIDLEGIPLDGGLLVKTMVLSIDPWMRGQMTVRTLLRPAARIVPNCYGHRRSRLERGTSYIT